MSMREKMARAIAEKELSSLLGILSDPVADNMFDVLWEKDTADLRTRALAQIDAALDVLMVPTEGMIANAYGEFSGPLPRPMQDDDRHFVTAIHRGMIQAIKDGK